MKLSTALALPLLSFTLYSCTNILLEAKPDGSSSARIYSLWANPTISGFNAAASPTEGRRLTIDSFSDNKTEGLDSFNKMLPGLVEGAVKGAVQGAK